MGRQTDKRRRRLWWEQDQAGDRWGNLYLDKMGDEEWFGWVYHVKTVTGEKVKREVCRIEFCVNDTELDPWFYVDGESYPLPDSGMSLETAESRYGAVTRLKLLQTHKEQLLTDLEAGFHFLCEKLHTQVPA